MCDVTPGRSSTDVTHLSVCIQCPAGGFGKAAACTFISDVTKYEIVVLFMVYGEAGCSHLGNTSVCILHHGENELN